MNTHLNSFVRYLLLSMFIVTAGGYAEPLSQRGNFDIKGFKGIELGMSSENVTSLGLKCKDEGISIEGEDSRSCSSKSTIFGYPASIFVLFDKNKVRSISVTAIGRQPIDLISPYTKVFGEPISAIITNPWGFKFKMNYWISRQGTSLQLATPLEDDGQTVREQTKDKSGSYNQTASYHGVSSTNEFLRSVKVTVSPELDY